MSEGRGGPRSGEAGRSLRFAFFYHSLRSDWNHGNAHFLRGVARELVARGHRVDVYEPADGWSVTHLRSEAGPDAIRSFHAAYPTLHATAYRPESLDLDAALDGVDVVLAHEWNDPGLIRELGRIRAARPELRLFFHDTHHRAVTAPEEMRAFDLERYDGVLAFGAILRDLYRERGWARAAWTWHEAADTAVFRPGAQAASDDIVWIGNWGDEERSQELEEFLIEPARALRLRGTVYGVRYPEHALEAVRRAGLRYGGWISNVDAPAVYARHRVTVHVPRRPYASALPGIPTIRVFEALACGIPLVSAPWEDAEGLFAPGRDFLVARDGTEMARQLQAVVNDPELGGDLAARGLATIEGRHTCAHRVDELFSILRMTGSPALEPRAQSVMETPQ